MQLIYKFSMIISILINIGIVLHLFKFGPRLALDYVISPNDHRRHLKWTFNGKLIFKFDNTKNVSDELKSK